MHIEDQALPADFYGLHVFVSEKEWTFIFSKNFKSWESFQYKASDDALSVKVKIEQVPHQEWLSYNFINREAESAKVELWWEETKASFKIDVDVTSNIINDLLEKEDKTSGDFLTLAEQTLKKNLSDYQLFRKASQINLTTTLYSRPAPIQILLT